jgi:signal transduction histidine kinase
MPPRSIVLLRRLVGRSTARPASDSPRRPHWAVIDKPVPFGRLRLRYEEQIREIARSEERARLARDLHDAIKQQLFVIQTSAATAQARWDTDPEAARASLDQVRSSARDAMTEMRAMIDNLQGTPLENAALVDALNTQCEALRLRTGATVTLDVGGLPAAEALPPGSQQAMCRFTQEALANVARHARASHVTVTVRPQGRYVRLEIRDDGAGFGPETHAIGMGIANMRARAGELGGRFAIVSGPDLGTTVAMLIPAVPFFLRSAKGRALATAALAVSVGLAAGLIHVVQFNGTTRLLLLLLAFVAAAVAVRFILTRRGVA